MGSQQESSAWPGTRRATADSIAVRVYPLKTNAWHMAFAAHQSWTQGGGGPLTQNHVTTPSIMITRHATAIIPSRVIIVAQKQKTSCRCVPAGVIGLTTVRRFMADSTAPPVFSILHHVTGRFRRTWIAGGNVLVA